MKKVLQELSTNTFSLYITSLLVTGLSVEKGLINYMLGGFILTLGDYILKPILKIITLPFNLITFGLFSLLINGITLFAITLIYSKINVTSFTFQGISYNGFTVPGFNVNVFLAYFIISGIIYGINKFVSWIFSKD